MNDNTTLQPDLTPDQNGTHRPPNGPVIPVLPRHVVEAYEAYRADLPILLVHLAGHPAERFVAYRGRQRLQYGTDEGAMRSELARIYSDGRFWVYEIDDAQNYPLHDTVV